MFKQYGVCLMESYKGLVIRAEHGSAVAKVELRRRESGYVRTGLRGIHGEEIVYSVTDGMWELLGYIDKVNISSDSSCLDAGLLEAYGSATIEGARTTVERVKENMGNPVTKDDRMVVNAIKAQDYAYNNGISLGNIRYVWEMLTDGVCGNAHLQGVTWRSGMVYIGSVHGVVHIPEEPGKIGRRMEDLFSFCGRPMDGVVKACIVHFYVAYIHPFCDGNGRMARLWMNSILAGYNRQFRWLAVSRGVLESLDGYYSSLRVAEFSYNNLMDITPFMEYMLQVIVSAIDSVGILK